MEINRVVKWVVKENDKDVAMIKYEVTDDTGSHELFSKDRVLSLSDIMEQLNGQKEPA